MEKMRGIVHKHFSELASHYDRYSEKRSNFLRKEEGLVVGALQSEKRPDMLVLDAGCGRGSRAMNIKQQLGDTKFYGYDLSDKMVALAGHKGYEKVEQATLDNPPFKDISFDVALCLFSVFTY